MLKKKGQHNGSPPVRLICPFTFKFLNNSLYCFNMPNNCEYVNCTGTLNYMLHLNAIAI